MTTFILKDSLNSLSACHFFLAVFGNSCPGFLNDIQSSSLDVDFVPFPIKTIPHCFPDVGSRQWGGLSMTDGILLYL